jgi:stringent starvation protein B
MTMTVDTAHRSRILSKVNFNAFYQYCTETSGIVDVVIPVEALGDELSFLLNNQFGDDRWKFVKLNVSPSAARDLVVDNVGISFHCRVDGVVRNITLKWEQILGVSSRDEPFLHLLHAHLVNDISMSYDPALVFIMMSSFIEDNQVPIMKEKPRPTLTVVK